MARKSHLTLSTQWLLPRMISTQMNRSNRLKRLRAQLVIMPGMFTANSMNCLTEALGLSLPPNGSTRATHSNQGRSLRQVNASLILHVAVMNKMIPAHCPQHRPFEAFENAMALDIAMGGSTNTVLHLWRPLTKVRSALRWKISTLVRKVPHK